MLTIFGKNLEELTFEDIVEFCKRGFPEGINLDYKREINGESGSLTKTIASFANTYGGWILIGVEDQDDKPKAPFKGIPITEKMKLTITNMIIDNISPIIIPEIKVVENSTKDRCFIVLCVSESEKTPHFVNDKKDLFIRVGSRAKSGRNRDKEYDIYASSENWEFLRNKREKSLKLAEKLEQDLNELYLSFKLNGRTEHELKTMSQNELEDGIFSLFIQPLFPRETLCLNNSFDPDFSNSVFFKKNIFPNSPSYFYQNGIYKTTPFANFCTFESFFNFIAQDIFGSATSRSLLLFTAKNNIGFGTREKILKGKKYFSISDFVVYIELFLQHMSIFYKKNNFIGELIFKIEIKGCKKKYLYINDSTIGISILNEFAYKLKINSNELLNFEIRKDIVLKICNSIGYFFGLDGVDSKEVDKIYNEINLN